MKQLITMLCLYSIAYSVDAQTQISKTIQANNLTSASLSFEYADVIIKTWEKSEIKITGTVYINMGKNDDEFDMEIKEKNGKISISTSVDAEALPKGIWDKKDGKSIRIHQDEVDDLSCVTYGSQIENKLTIMIPSNLILESSSIYGTTTVVGFTNSIKINNTYGFINASAKELIKSNKMEFTSIYAAVDLSLPRTAKVNMELKTDFGQIYSDLDMDIITNRSLSKKMFGDRIKSTLNGGGNKIKLESNYSNIYVRES